MNFYLICQRKNVNEFISEKERHDTTVVEEKLDSTHDDLRVYDGALKFSPPLTRNKLWRTCSRDGRDHPPVKTLDGAQMRHSCGIEIYMAELNEYGRSIPTSWEEEACSSGLQGNVILRRLEDWRDDGEGAAQTTRHAWGSMIDWVSIISENVNLIDKCLGTIEIWRPSVLGMFNHSS